MFDDKNATPEGPDTGHSAVEPAPVAPTDRHRRAGRKGGKAAKQSLILTGLGVAVPALDMATSAGRVAVIEAVATAVVLGKCSGLTATTLLAAVREARAEALADQDEIIRELERRLDARVVR